MVSKERLEEYVKVIYGNSSVGTEKNHENARVSVHLVLWPKFELIAFPNTSHRSAQCVN